MRIETPNCRVNNASSGDRRQHQARQPGLARPPTSAVLRRGEGGPASQSVRAAG